MYCPKCGQSDQNENSFCRKCGTFLPDFDKIKSKEISPEQHFLANNTLTIMTAIVSLGLAITLYVMFLGQENTPLVIYLTAGFLTAMFFWQVQIFWRNWQLKKYILSKIKQTEPAQNPPSLPLNLTSYSTEKLLPASDLSNVIQSSVTETTTKQLVAPQAKSS